VHGYRRWIALGLLLAGLSGCRPAGSSNANQAAGSVAPLIAVSSSYLAAALRDLLGEDVTLLVLAEPGMCPGHFDLRPSQVAQLRACALLARFDFQQSLDARLADGATQVVAVSVPGGMCVPASYQEVCRQLADVLVAQQRLSQSQADRQLAAVAERMKHLADWCHAQIDAAGLRDQPVLCSGHQAAFCRSLGLSVAATFSAADTAQASQIDQAVKQGEKAAVRLVIANRPEGRQLADALADRLQAKVLVFGNFPNGQTAHSFDRLVRDNLELLTEAARQIKGLAENHPSHVERPSGSELPTGSGTGSKEAAR